MAIAWIVVVSFECHRLVTVEAETTLELHKVVSLPLLRLIILPGHRGTCECVACARDGWSFLDAYWLHQ